MNDLISRQNVLRCLTDISYNQCKTQGEADVIDTAKTMVAVMPSAQSEPCEDAISRQAAIDALMKRDKELRDINWYDKPFAEGECRGIDYALEIVNALPSAQPEIIRCKDCKYADDDCVCQHSMGLVIQDDDDYCSYAERRADEQTVSE